MGKEFFAATDEIRGAIDARECKHILLRLLILRYASETFVRRRERLPRSSTLVGAATNTSKNTYLFRSSRAGPLRCPVKVIHPRSGCLLFRPSKTCRYFWAPCCSYD
ncbi:type I restriction-modification system subunit M N-terminal domain-containing protein [Caballeronia sp. ATUFL_F2_KS9A]|uniref:type I restriction-modification system subunit M N-terminal domain-containing protein n=1 Tax=Caballeronia sp. ATUFL_F2_KS9A TaxID=2921777 RepID=UPI0032ECA624